MPQSTMPQGLLLGPQSIGPQVGSSQQRFSRHASPLPQPPQFTDPHVLLLVSQSPLLQVGSEQHWLSLHC
jgi:hypothetical protein